MSAVRRTMSNICDKSLQFPENHVYHLTLALKKLIIKMSKLRNPLYLSLLLAPEMQKIILLLLQIL